MNATVWSRVQEIVSTAADLPVAERQAWLATSCAGNDLLRQQVDDMLAAYSQAGDFFEQAINSAAVQAASLNELGPGERLGPYEITEILGHGGMGTVYRASRADDQFQQDVAIKVVRSAYGMSEQLFARFRAERQILANINHPNIARLLDGGVTATGMPFLVMEFIEGTTLDRYLAEHTVGLPERLALFRELCAAIQCAHQNLVVHRDLKPANVMVTSDGSPKLLDFGIAKLLVQEPTEGTVFLTRPVERVMTPEYASPEQVRGENINTAADIYGLGVVLYELVTGQRPFRLSGLSTAEMERVICETQPARPSAVVSNNLQGTWRRRATDLDRITLKALHKEPGRRYASAADLAADVQRYLDGFPVAARPDSFRYRTSRFVARHTIAVAAAVLFVLTVIGLSIGLAVQRNHARQEAASADAVSEYLVGLFQFTRPDATQGRSVSARDLLDQGTQQLNGSWKGQPAVRARLLSTLGRVYFQLGAMDRAESLLSKAEQLYGTQSSSSPAAVADTADYLGITLLDRSDYDGAKTAFQRAQVNYEKAEGHENGDVADVLSGLGAVELGKGDFDEAERHQRQAIALNTRTRGPEDTNTLIDKHNLEVIYTQRGNYKAALALVREVLETNQRKFGENQTVTASDFNDIGFNLDKLGHLSEAATAHQQALAIRRKIFGKEHPHIAMSLVLLGWYDREVGHLEEARQLTEQGVAMSRKLVGEKSLDTAFQEDALALVRLANGDPVGAKPLVEQALRTRLAQSHPSPGLLSQSYDYLGLVALARGDLNEAHSRIEQALHLRERFYPTANDWLAISYNHLGRVLMASKDAPGAQQAYATALRIAQQNFGDAPHPITAEALFGSGTALLAQEQRAAGEVRLKDALRLQQALYEPDHPDLLATTGALRNVQRHP